MRAVALSPLKVWGPFQKQLETVTPSPFLGLLALRCSDCPECTLQHQHSPRETRAGGSVDALGSVGGEPQVGTYIRSELKSASDQQPLLPCPVLTQHKSREVFLTVLSFFFLTCIFVFTLNTEDIFWPIKPRPPGGHLPPQMCFI